MGSVYRPKYKDKKTGEIWEQAVYWIKYYKGGRAIRESAHTEKLREAEARLKLKEGLAVQGHPVGIKTDRVTFDALAEDYLNSYRANDLRSIERAKECVDHLKRFFEAQRAVNITTDRVRAYIASRKAEKGTKGQPVANGTINREIGALKRMFNLGIQAGKVVRPPFIERLKENNVRTGFYTHEEYRAIKKGLPAHAVLPVTIAYYTGMRAGEILSLVWIQINLVEGKILLSADQTKNKTPRTIYLRGELFVALLEAHTTGKEKHPDCPWVCHRKGKRLLSFRKAWKKALEAAAKELKRPELKDRLFHDFRRTGVRNMIRSGVPETVAMKISGHKTRSVFDRYNIVSEKDLEAAADRVIAYHVATQQNLEGATIQDQGIR